ncbi:MAG: oligosaccharide flippase family protein [Eubacterium sp.]|nr:oligosaccharide flippase family protein [Eubacterium sp.]
MSYKKTILTGTLLLTISGILSRILGFYNRIFLADLIGAKELGIYSLIFPAYALCFTLVCHGFETGISNMTSRLYAGRQGNQARRLVHLTCLINLVSSLLLTIFLYKTSCYLSKYLLKNPSCQEPLRIASLALPFVAVKACIHGYYIGRGKSGVSAFSQLIEQSARVVSIYLLSITLYAASADVRLAVWGMVCGEAVSAVYTIFAYLYTILLRPYLMERKSTRTIPHNSHKGIGPGKTCSSFHECTETKRTQTRALLRDFFSFSIPLTVNHFCLTMVSSLESILIPYVLMQHFGDQDLALAAFGRLTGMALPFLYFPAAITNSLSVMLLPAISASYKQKKMAQIRYTISQSLHYCIVIGIFSTFAFRFYGNLLGETVFHSIKAGQYIYSFAVLCPFMYAASTIMSILNGFGLTKKTMYHSLLCVAVRIACILTLIPLYGIQGYLIGMLAGYVLQLILDLITLLKITTFSFSVEKTILLPAALSLGGGWLSQKLYACLGNVMTIHPLVLLALCGISYALFFTVTQLGIQYLSAQSEP